jgi:ABC-type sugar transport system permease subunit
MSESASTVEAPPRELPPQDEGPGFFQRYGTTALFLAPALVLLGVWIVYPTIRTIIRSFFDATGDEFVWFDNYEELFRSDVLFTAIKNNAVWVLVVPALVTAMVTSSSASTTTRRCSPTTRSSRRSRTTSSGS